ncbi:MAG: asparagine--tRNA ligase [Clostridium sp. CAG:245_30_32]|nr:MAG: asparagine--tRNA ligase [Clostridium sp. CAG:245_30_32]
MKKVTIKDLYRNTENYIDKTVEVAGWVRTVRDSKAFGFIELNDGSFFNNLQIVFNDKLANFEEVRKLTISSSIIVNGKVVKTENAKQPFEIHADSVEIFNLADADYPLQKKRHSFEYLRTVAHLRPRTNTFNAVFRIRSVAAFAIHEYFQNNGYVYVNTPIITCADCEGSAEMFKLTTLDLDKPLPQKDGKTDFSEDLFGKKAYITGSGQLHGETFAEAYGKIYTFGPTLRSENSNTKTHANEFWMIEPEIAFCDLEQLMDIEEDCLKFVVSKVLEKCPEEMEFCDKFIEQGLIDKLHKLVNSKFVRIDHKEAIDILKKADKEWEFKPEYGEDLAKEHEKYLTEYFNGPVFVKNWPKDIKSYYMKLNPDGETVAGVDLEVPGAGEIMGGSQREENYDKLVARMKEMGIATEPLYWYLDLRRYGSVIHSGFGLGFERLLMYITGIENIRDVIPYPRTPNNCDF